MKITYDTGFTQMPNNILRSHTLKPLQKVVLSVICSYSNSSNIAFPSYQTIADDSGISRRKVIDIISELVMFGYIKKTERRSNKGDHTANDYEVLIGRSDFSLPGETSAPQGNEYNSPPDELPSLPGSEISASRSEQRAPNQYINKNINNSFNNINLSITANEIDAMTNQIKENIDYDILCERYSGDMLDELVSVMTEAICGNSKTVRIAGNDFAREVVKSQLLKINSEHIEYVLDCIKKNTTKIKNIKAYMLTCIYNAPQTISSFYTAEVNHDLYGCG